MNQIKELPQDITGGVRVRGVVSFVRLAPCLCVREEEEENTEASA